MSVHESVKGSYLQKSERAPTPTRYHYYNNEIYIFCFDPSGKLLWNKVVNKKQHFLNINIYGGYVFIPNGNDLNLIHNDDPKNRGIKDVTLVNEKLGVYDKARESDMVRVKITAEGPHNKTE